MSCPFSAMFFSPFSLFSMLFLKDPQHLSSPLMNKRYKLREILHVLQKQVKKNWLCILTSTVICLLIFRKACSKKSCVINLRSLLQFLHCIAAFANFNSTLLLYGHLEFGLAERLNFTEFFYGTITGQMK